MTTVADLLNELNALPSTLSYTSSSAANDVFEGYVFKLVLDGAIEAGATVSFADVHGNLATHLTFRTSPGRLYSTSRPYTHAVLSFPGCPDLEVHVGVQTQGRSKVLHECDVLVLPTMEADISRNRNVSPRGGYSLFAVECKFYVSSLQLHLARAFLGLHQDLGVKLSYFVANTVHKRIERLVNHHGRKWETGVVPASNEATFLVGQFREAFKGYQAANGTLP